VMMGLELPAVDLIHLARQHSMRFGPSSPKIALLHRLGKGAWPPSGFAPSFVTATPIVYNSSTTVKGRCLAHERGIWRADDARTGHT
jgi:hypothetical protein